MPERLRDLKRYADNHQVVSLSLLDEAASYIERLEAQIAETRAYLDEQDALMVERMANKV